MAWPLCGETNADPEPAAESGACAVAPPPMCIAAADMLLWWCGGCCGAPDPDPPAVCALALAAACAAALGNAAAAGAVREMSEACACAGVVGVLNGGAGGVSMKLDSDGELCALLDAPGRRALDPVAAAAAPPAVISVRPFCWHTCCTIERM